MKLREIYQQIQNKSITYFKIKPDDEDEQSYSLKTKGKGKFNNWLLLAYCCLRTGDHASLMRRLSTRLDAKVLDYK